MAIRCGAIRWDAWYDATGTGLYAQQAAHGLSLAAYQSRAPFFATKLNANKLIINGASQATIDAEIAYAANAGLKYWCFGYYSGTGNVLGFNVAWQLYQSSTQKNLINWCWTRGIDGSLQADMGSGLLASQMAQSNYEKVLTNRPLLFLQVGTTLNSAPSWWAGALSTLQSACAAAGIGNPYIVIQGMGNGTAGVETTRASLTADAQGAYAIGTAVTNGAYTSLDTLAQTYAAAMAASSAKIIPVAMTGWSPQPRNARPENFAGSYRAHIGMNNAYALPTPAELVTHIGNMKTYITSNATACEAQSLLIYAWNEFTEAGASLCPTYTAGGPNTAYLSALTGTL